jgi:hypothetical protein
VRHQRQRSGGIVSLLLDASQPVLEWAREYVHRHGLSRNSMLRNRQNTCHAKRMEAHANHRHPSCWPQRELGGQLASEKQAGLRDGGPAMIQPFEGIREMDDELGTTIREDRLHGTSQG